MKLTALEIKQQSFEKSIRGYDVAEVNAFLDMVASEWEHLVARNKELEQQLANMEDKLKHYERVESALHETLQTAKESAEHKLTGARREAQNRIDKAEIEAESIIREAQQQRQQIRQSILRLLERRKEIISSIRSYLDRARESLDHFADDEASLYALPPEDSIESTMSNKKPVEPQPTADSEEEQKDISEQDEEKRPEKDTKSGGDELDTIIDEIE